MVTEEASSSEAVLLAELKPFPAISFDGTCGGVTVPSDLKLVCYSMQCAFFSTYSLEWITSVCKTSKDPHHLSLHAGV